MDHTSTYEAYMMFRMTEEEHVAKNYPHWTEESANPDYERWVQEEHGNTR